MDAWLRIYHFYIEREKGFTYKKIAEKYNTNIRYVRRSISFMYDLFSFYDETDYYVVMSELAKYTKQSLRVARLLYDRKISFKDFLKMTDEEIYELNYVGKSIGGAMIHARDNLNRHISL